MAALERNDTKRAGFTLIELMIVVAIIGIISVVALPIFTRYQANSKTSEVKTNLGSLRVAEEAFFAEHDAYHAANPEPPFIPGPVQVTFDAVSSDFSTLGWSPEGRVYFSYGVFVSLDGVGYTADGGADTDGDGVVQLWGYTKPDGSNAVHNGNVGCDVSFLTPAVLGRCGVDNSIY